jgi:hypothetical protein
MAVNKRATAATAGQRPDPAAGFLAPRPEPAAGANDPLRGAKERAVGRSEVLGAAALGSARRFVRASGSGRGVKVADDTVVATAQAKIAAIRRDANLSPQGQQAGLDAVNAEVRQEVQGVLGRIAAARQETAPGPGPGTVRLKVDPLLDSLLAYGTAGQVVAALDNASGDVAINDGLWAARALIDGRLQGSDKRLDIVAAMNRAQARMTVMDDWLGRQLLAARLDGAEHAVRLGASELFRNGYVDVAFAATGVFRSLDEAPAGDLAGYFDAVVQSAANPSGSPWVLAPDGTLTPGGAIEGEKAGPLRTMADDSYSQI